MGKKPMPTHLKLVTGNRGRRPLNQHEPQAPTGAPEKPAHFEGYESEVWDRLVAELGAIGVLHQTDSLAMEMLCQAYSDHRTAVEHVRECAKLAAMPLATKRLLGLDETEYSACGRYYRTVGTAGAIMKRANPAIADRSDADRRIRSWASEFGLTPASRSRIAVGGAVEDDVAKKYFG